MVAGTTVLILKLTGSALGAHEDLLHHEAPHSALRLTGALAPEEEGCHSLDAVPDSLGQAGGQFLTVKVFKVIQTKV